MSTYAPEAAAPVVAAPPAGRVPALDRPLAAVLVLAGVLGLAAAFALTIDKLRLLENPLYVPACELGEVLSCSSVIRSEQAEAFGFPNPLLGLVGFSVLLATGAALASGGRLARPYWLGLQVGLTLAVVFVHWLIFQTLYRIGAVCPFCMVVWAVTIPAFWYVTLRTLRPLLDGGGAPARAVALLTRNHAIGVTLWLLLVAALVYERFWAPWDSVLG